MELFEAAAYTVPLNLDGDMITCIVEWLAF